MISELVCTVASVPGGRSPSWSAYLTFTNLNSISLCDVTTIHSWSRLSHVSQTKTKILIQSCHPPAPLSPWVECTPKARLCASYWSTFSEPRCVTSVAIREMVELWNKVVIVENLRISKIVSRKTLVPNEVWCMWWLIQEGLVMVMYTSNALCRLIPESFSTQRFRFRIEKCYRTTRTVRVSTTNTLDASYYSMLLIM